MDISKCTEHCLHDVWIHEMGTECLLSHRAQHTHHNHIHYTHAHFTDRDTTETFVRNLTKVLLLGNKWWIWDFDTSHCPFLRPQCLSYTFNEHYHENYMTQSTWEGWDEGEKQTQTDHILCVCLLGTISFISLHSYNSPVDKC